MAQNQTPMNKTSDKWFITINPPKENPSREVLEGYVDAITSYFVEGFNASIIHDQDKNEDGTPKTIHCHCYIETPSKPTKKAVLSDLKELIDINTEQAGIEATNSPILLVQYLTHQNHKEKAQYNEELIKTNDVSELCERLHTKYEKTTASQELLAIETLKELIDKKGVEFARKNKGLWKDLREEQRTHYDLELELEKANEYIADLEAQIERLQKRLSNYENIELYKQNFETFETSI